MGSNAMSGSTHSPEAKAHAIGLAMTLGAKRAAAETGIPRRTISSWMGTPAAQVIEGQTREQIADKLWTAVQTGVDVILRRMTDPHARLSEVAKALEVVASQHSLLTGQATARSESVNLNVNTVREPLGLDPETRRFLAEWVREIENAPDDQLTEFDARYLNVFENVRTLVVSDHSNDYYRFDPGLDVSKALADDLEAHLGPEADPGIQIKRALRDDVDEIEGES